MACGGAIELTIIERLIYNFQYSTNLVLVTPVVCDLPWVHLQQYMSIQPKIINIIGSIWGAVDLSSHFE